MTTHSRSPLFLLSWILVAAGFFTCTWDLFATVELSNRTLKLHQLLFFLGSVSAFFSAPKEFTLEALRALRRPFPIFFLALLAYYTLRLPASFYPEKSALYIAWTIFNFVTIWITFNFLAPSARTDLFARLLAGTVFFLSTITLIDHVAYQYGHVAGLIGHNQDLILHWGASRPHAFANEPSYLAAFLALCLITLAPFLRAQGTKWYFFVAYLTGLSALVATTSRTGWISYAAGTGLVFLALSLRERRMLWRPFAICALGFGIAFGLFWALTPQKQLSKLDDSLLSSMIQGRDGAGNARIQAHRNALVMARETSWLGTGLGASFRYWATNHEPQEIQNQSSFPPEKFGAESVMSIWGQLLAEGGLPGVLLYALAALSLLLALWRRWILASGPLTLGALVSATVFFVFTAWWIGNIARGDVWVWFAIWAAIAAGRFTPRNPQARPTT